MLYVKFLATFLFDVQADTSFENPGEIDIVSVRRFNKCYCVIALCEKFYVFKYNNEL